MQYEIEEQKAKNPPHTWYLSIGQRPMMVYLKKLFEFLTKIKIIVVGNLKYIQEPKSMVALGSKTTKLYALQRD